MMRRVILSISILLFATFSWLVITESGLLTTLAIAQRFAPELTVEEATGSLYDGGVFKQIHYQIDENSHVAIDNVTLDWQSLQLLSGRVVVDKLLIGNVNVTYLATESTTDTEQLVLPNIVLPLPLYLNYLRINTVTYHDLNQISNRIINGLTSEFQLGKKGLIIQSLLLEHADDKRLEIKGGISLKDNYQTDLAFEWNVNNRAYKEINATGSIKGTTTELRVEQQLITPIRSSQSITFSDLLNELKWAIAVDIPELNIADFIPDQTSIIDDFILKAKGDLRGATIDLESHFIQDGLPELSFISQATSQDFDNWIFESELSADNDSSISIEGQVYQVFTSPNLILSGQWKQLAWPFSEIEKQGKSKFGEFTLTGDLDNYVLSVKGELETLQQQLSFSANADGTANDISIKQLQLTGLGGNATIAGWLNWQSEITEYDLIANLSEITLPKEISDKDIIIHQSLLKLKGTLDNAFLKFDSQLAINATPIVVDVSGDISQQGATNIAISSNIGQGKLNFVGDATWQDLFGVRGKVKLDKLNPAVIVPEWSGVLSGGWQMAISNIADNNADMIIQNLDIKGILRERSVHVLTDLSYLSQQLTIPKLQLHSGKSTITASGQINDVAVLDWHVISPDLADLYPELTGQLEAKGTISGNRNSPIVAASVSGQEIGYSKLFTLEQLTSDFSVDMNQQGKLNSTTLLSQLTVNNVNVTSAKIAISGSQEKHQLDFDISSKEMQSTGHLIGGLSDIDWQGKITQLQLNHTIAGKWLLAEQGSLTLAKDYIVIDKHCLQSQNGSSCLQANYNEDGTWNSEGQFKSVPLNLLHSFSSALEPLQGYLNGQFELSGRDQYPLLGKGNIDLKEGSFLLSNAALTDDQTIHLSSASIDYALTGKGSALNVLIVPDMKGVSALTGRLSLPTMKTVIDTPNKAGLSGHFKTVIEDLSEFDGLHPEYEKLQGQLDIDFVVAGTISAPQATGDISLTETSVELPSLGLILSDINATAQGDLVSGINVDYRAKSGEGNLSGNGQVVFSDKGWTIVAGIKGDNAEFVNLPEAYIVASPDLSIKMNSANTQIDGVITIPTAELSPMQFNMPVTASKDVVILSHKIDEKKQSLPTHVNINVILGDKVLVTGIGFDGRLTGNVVVTGNTNKLLLGTGEIKIEAGNYLAYGQKLGVDGGKIHFSGAALDNPDLDIKAVRKGDEFTAGLQLIGPANNPQINLFSTPWMSDDDVLAHLILGHSLAEANVSDAAILASAATGLGVKGGNMIGEQIASTFGLESVAISGEGDDTALQVGKYLSPRLYLGYGIGIFEPVSTVNLRYKLSDIWSLKAESGEETAVDLLYTHER